jgi:hypothetical protein
MNSPESTHNSSSTITEPDETPCGGCARLIADMHAATMAVHDYIIEHRDQRAVNESYLGDLGRLIQAQVVTHRNLVQHQRSHAISEETHAKRAI